MSEKVELIAAAQVTADPSAITFLSNFGFKTATRSSPGVYSLTLDHHHNPDHLVVGVTRSGSTSGEITASLPTGDKVDSVTISNFDDTDAAADTAFFVTVYRVRD
jgi:hypothetical protein